jgi:hypothetical protein
MKISEILVELQRAYDEFGDMDGELFDAMDMEMFQPITHVRFEQERGRMQFLSDR